MHRNETPIALVLTAFLLAGCVSAAPDAPAAETHAARSSPMETPMGTEPVPPDQAPESLTLRLGAEAKLPDGSRLAYTELINDSRCPPDVQCIWAGNAEIRLRWTPAQDGSSKDFTLNTNSFGGKPTSATIGIYEIRIASMEHGSAPTTTFELKRIAPHGNH